MWIMGGKRNFFNIWVGYIVKWVSFFIIYNVCLLWCLCSNCLIFVIFKIVILFIWGLCCVMLIIYKYIGCLVILFFWIWVIFMYNVFRNIVVFKIYDDISLIVNVILIDYYKIIIWNIFEKNDNELKIF